MKLKPQYRKILNAINKGYTVVLDVNHIGERSQRIRLITKDNCEYIRYHSYGEYFLKSCYSSNWSIKHTVLGMAQYDSDMKFKITNIAIFN